MAATVTPEKVVKFLEAPGGRDKLARAMQYVVKAYGWRVSQQPSPTASQVDLAKRLGTVEAQASLARKLFRFGKSLQLAQAAVRAATDGTVGDGVVRSTTCVQNGALAAWLLYDHCIWAQKVGLATSFDLKKLGRRANWFWLLAMTMGIAKSAHLLRLTSHAVVQREREGPEGGEDKVSLASLKKRQSDVFWELLRNVFDLPIPLSGLSESFAETVSPGTVGLCGAFTSFIGIYQTWDKL